MTKQNITLITDTHIKLWHPCTHINKALLLMKLSNAVDAKNVTSIIATNNAPVLYNMGLDMRGSKQIFVHYAKI